MLETSPRSTLTAGDAARLLDATATTPDRPIVLLTHAKPDGDAFGSVVAVAASLQSLGKHTLAPLVPPIPEHFALMPGYDLTTPWHADLDVPADPALVVVLDTCARSQLGPLADYADRRPDRTLVIDHHLSGDLLAEHRLIQPEAAAVCEILPDVLDALGTLPSENTIESSGDGESTSRPQPHHRVIASALYTGLATDTGWFRYSNTSAGTHRLAARLLGLGVNHDDLFRRLEQCGSIAKLRLTARALASLHLVAGGKGAVMALSLHDFEATDARPEETEGIINLPQVIASVQVVALATEATDHNGDGPPVPVTRISFRSKPACPDDCSSDAVDVAALAAAFNGGGHARAAGAKVTAPLHDVLPRLAAAVEDAVR